MYTLWFHPWASLARTVSRGALCSSTRTQYEAACCGRGLGRAVAVRYLPAAALFFRVCGEHEMGRRCPGGTSGGGVRAARGSIARDRRLWRACSCFLPLFLFSSIPPFSHFLFFLILFFFSFSHHAVLRNYYSTTVNLIYHHFTKS